MCPLCRVAHKADREYIWHFFDVGADQGESLDTVRHAFGFCAEHIEMLRRPRLVGQLRRADLSSQQPGALQRNQPRRWTCRTCWSTDSIR